MVFEPMSGSSQNMNPSAAVGMSKVFMLDKYFSELQKFWDTEKRLQGRFLHKNHYLGFLQHLFISSGPLGLNHKCFS